MSKPALDELVILIAEDEYMIAEELVMTLREEGGTVLGPVSTVAEALSLIATEWRIDVALLDVNLRGEQIWPVVEALRARGISLVLSTGYDASAIPLAYAGLPRCEKPASSHDVIGALARAHAA